MLFLSSALAVIALALSIHALFPNIKNPKRSATFFGSISRWSEEEYKRFLEPMDIDAWKAEYINQIHVVSRIATVKYEGIVRATWVFVSAQILVGIAYFLALNGN